MRRVGVAGYPFIALGIAFVAIGFSGRKPFIIIGTVFIAIGFILLRRMR